MLIRRPLSAITCPLTCLFGPFVTSQEEEPSLKVIGGTAAAWNSICPGNTLIVCHKSTWERKDHGLEEISHLGGEYTGSCTLESDLWFLLCSHRPLFILNCSLGFRHGGCDFWNLSSLETLEQLVSLLPSCQQQCAVLHVYACSSALWPGVALIIYVFILLLAFLPSGIENHIQ